MNKYFLLFLVLISFHANGQSEKETDNLSIAITSYLFPENSIYPDGCYAIGPTFFLNDERISLELSFLYDLNEYYSYVGDNSPHTYKKEKAYHFFVGFSMNYKYFTTGKFDFLAGAGLYLENRPEYIGESNNMPLRIGMGVSYKFLKYFNYKVTPSLQLTNGNLYAGLLMDLVYSFDITHKRK